MLHITTAAPTRELPRETEGDAGSFRATFQAIRNYFPSSQTPGVKCLSQDGSLSNVPVAAMHPCDVVLRINLLLLSVKKEI